MFNRRAENFFVVEVGGDFFYKKKWSAVRKISDH